MGVLAEPQDQTIPPGTDVPALPQQGRNGIPVQARRSMEDELRLLPAGWVREFDPETQHQFFVDTMSSPPRSIWHHPCDDETFLNSLPTAERARICASNSALCPSRQRRPTAADLIAESTAEEEEEGGGGGEEEESGSDSGNPTSSSNRQQKKQPVGLGLGRRLKDRLTGTTHAQRAAARARRAAAEHDLYRQHRVLRRAMRDAMRSGRAQPLGRDADRTRLFLEPPGHTFPGVARADKVSPYLCQVVYMEEEEEEEGAAGGGDKRGGRRRRCRPGPPGRYFRPEGDMYGVGYGAYGCGKFAGGRWDRPGEEYKRLEGHGFGGGLGIPDMVSLVEGTAKGGVVLDAV
ncbi:hypothetical protein VTK56DRAFT_10116 [Thermocarpiscus australiensis]